MTNEDKIALKEFLSGAAGVIIVVGIFILFIVGTSGNFNPPKSTEPVVVDTYENCDIIRWSTNQMAEYKYFLKCND